MFHCLKKKAKQKQKSTNNTKQKKKKKKKKPQFQDSIDENIYFFLKRFNSVFIMLLTTVDEKKIDFGSV